MQFDDQRVDTSGIDDLRDGRSGGMGGGGGLGGVATASILSALLRGRGGRGGLALLVVGLLVMAAMSMCSSGASGPSASLAPSGSSGDLQARCNQAGAIEQYPDCLLAKAFNEPDEVWADEFSRRGLDYGSPRLTFFDGTVNTACGPASTAVGPFYCPGDARIYVDLGFARQLQQLGVSGDYANVYIMAHEFGHHLQNITGIEQQVRRAQQQDRRNASRYGVAMELQADCFAGVWGRMANDRGNVAVTQREVTDAMNAAAAVGDDRIQQQAGVRVNPETWTHGSAAQRQQWYLTGFNSGDIDRCTTFS